MIIGSVCESWNRVKFGVVVVKNLSFCSSLFRIEAFDAHTAPVCLFCSWFVFWFGISFFYKQLSFKQLVCIALILDREKIHSILVSIFFSCFICFVGCMLFSMTKVIYISSLLVWLSFSWSNAIKIVGWIDIELLFFSEIKFIDVAYSFSQRNSFLRV